MDNFVKSNPHNLSQAGSTLSFAAVNGLHGQLPIGRLNRSASPLPSGMRATRMGRRYANQMARTFVAGVPGVRKSTQLAELARRGHETIDTEYGGEESPIEFCRACDLRVTASRGSRVDERSHLTRDELDKPDGIRVVGSRLEHHRIGAGIRPSLHGGGDRGGVPSDSDIV